MNVDIIRKLVSSFVIIVITIIVATIVNKSFKKAYERLTKKLKRVKIDQTKFVIVRRLIVTGIYILGFSFIIFSIPELRALSYSLLAGAGILAVVIGFATQKVFSNIMSGIFIALFEPFRVGDRVKIGEDYGVVEDITLRHTVIKTWDNKRIIIPNSQISEMSIVNYSIKDEKVLKTLDIGISYDSDIDKAKKIMIDEVKKHPDYLDIRTKAEIDTGEEPVKVRVTELGDFAVNLRLYFWAKDKPTAFKMGCDLLESIKKRFDKAGIEIPFPYRTIVYKKSLKRK